MKMSQSKPEILFFFKCHFIGGRIPKQSSSLSSPIETAGVIEPDELDWDKTIFGSWLCIIPCTICRYSSSILAEARRAAV
jgi:hypothetical protein